MDAAERDEMQTGRSLRLWLSDQQWIQLLEQVERSAREFREVRERGETSINCQREEERTPFHVRCAIRTQDFEGRSATYIVQCRNITSGGLGFLIQPRLDPGTRCTIALQGNDGQGLIAAAAVAWCRAIDQDVCEVGVQFDRPIDVSDFVENQTNASA